MCGLYEYVGNNCRTKTLSRGRVQPLGPQRGKFYADKYTAATASSTARSLLWHAVLLLLAVQHTDGWSKFLAFFHVLKGYVLALHSFA